MRISESAYIDFNRVRLLSRAERLLNGTTTLALIAAASFWVAVGRSGGGQPKDTAESKIKLLKKIVWPEDKS